MLCSDCSVLHGVNPKQKNTECQYALTAIENGENLPYDFITV